MMNLSNTPSHFYRFKKKKAWQTNERLFDRLFARLNIAKKREEDYLVVNLTRPRDY